MVPCKIARIIRAPLQPPDLSPERGAAEASQLAKQASKNPPPSPWEACPFVLLTLYHIHISSPLLKLPLGLPTRETKACNGVVQWWKSCWAEMTSARMYVRLVAWVLNTCAPNLLSISQSAGAKGKEKGETRRALFKDYHLRITN